MSEGIEAMRRLLQRISAATSARFRALDRRLHIDHSGRSEWIWAVPFLTLAGTLGLVVVAGSVMSGTSPALYLPIGLLVGVLMAGMSVAYMTPADEDERGDEGDGGSRRQTSGPPAPIDHWWRWLQEPHASRLPREPPSSRRASESTRERERQRTGTR
jgi:hypothetical protein